MEEKKEEKKEEIKEKEMVEIGKVTHFFGHVSAAAIELSAGDLKVGDTIYIKGHTSDFEQKVDSLHLDNASVETATKGQGVGVKVKEHVRTNDVVYKILE